MHQTAVIKYDEDQFGAGDRLRIKLPTSIARRADTIRESTTRFERDFASWLNTVGNAMIEARDLLSDHGIPFATFCRQEFNWSSQHGLRIIAAKERLDAIALGGCDPELLPQNEAQLRSLSGVPLDQLPGVWERLVQRHQEFSEPVTAKSIRLFVEPLLPPKQKPLVEAAFDWPNAVQRLKRVIRAEVRQWPKGWRADAKPILQSWLTKEFGEDFQAAYGMFELVNGSLFPIHDEPEPIGNSQEGFQG